MILTGPIYITNFPTRKKSQEVWWQAICMPTLGIQSCHGRQKFTFPPCKNGVYNWLVEPTLQSLSSRDTAIGMNVSNSSPMQMIMRCRYCLTPECSSSRWEPTSNPHRKTGRAWVQETTINAISENIYYINRLLFWVRLFPELWFSWVCIPLVKTSPACKQCQCAWLYLSSNYTLLTLTWQSSMENY